MTNVQSYQSNAIKAQEQGKLNLWESNFVDYIKDMNKKQLNALSSKQFKTLRDIAEKAF